MGSTSEYPLLKSLLEEKPQQLDHPEMLEHVKLYIEGFMRDAPPIAVALRDGK